MNFNVQQENRNLNSNQNLEFNMYILFTPIPICHKPHVILKT